MTFAFKHRTKIYLNNKLKVKNKAEDFKLKGMVKSFIYLCLYISIHASKIYTENNNNRLIISFFIIRMHAVLVRNLFLF